MSRPDRAARLDALAAQYALGTLSPRARRRLAAIARTEPAVAAAITGWELRLAALAQAVPNIVPPPRAWEGIRSRLGLTAGSGMFMFAFVACAFVIAVLWLLESFEPAARSCFDLKISTKNAVRLKPDVEYALGQKKVAYELHRSSPHELVYEVTVPFEQKIRPLTKLIQQLDGHDGMLVEWEIKKVKKAQTVEA